MTQNDDVLTRIFTTTTNSTKTNIFFLYFKVIVTHTILYQLDSLSVTYTHHPSLPKFGHEMVSDVILYMEEGI